MNPGSFDCLPFMKSQLLKHSVVIRLSNVRFPRLHFAIHSDHKLSVSLQEDEEDALSKDLGMHGDVSCSVRRRTSQVRRV